MDTLCRNWRIVRVPAENWRFKSTSEKLTDYPWVCLIPKTLEAGIFIAFDVQGATTGATHTGLTPCYVKVGETWTLAYRMQDFDLKKARSQALEIAGELRTQIKDLGPNGVPNFKKITVPNNK